MLIAGFAWSRLHDLERRHLEEVEKFLASHELTAARQAVAQTLERLRADVALRERLQPELDAALQKK